MNRLRALTLVALAFSLPWLLTATSPARAQTFPEKPLRLIVPYAPGGTTDILARVIAAGLQQQLKQSVVVENKPGAGGAVGSAWAASQPADGYTLVMMVESSHAVNPSVRQKTAYDPVKDFSPISNIANVPGVLVVNPAFPAQTFAGLMAQIKNKPGQYTFGHSGLGGLSHLNGAIFMHTTGTKLLHIPYKGLGPALIDLVSGQIDIVFDNIPSSAGLLQGGKTRPLAVSAPARLKMLPDIPTYAELGLPEMNNPSWFGIGAPANTPEPILDILNQAVRAALETPDVISAIEQQGAIPDPTARADFSRLVAAENARWQKVVADIGFEKM